MKGSHLIIPLSVIMNLLIINITLYLSSSDIYSINLIPLFVTISWLLIGVGLNFYNIDRKEKFNENFHRFLRHYIIFCLSYFTILSFLKVDFNPVKQMVVLLALLSFLTIYRWCFFEFRKLYRKMGGNSLNVIIIGYDKNLVKLEKVFNNPVYGFNYLGFFHKNLSVYNDLTGKHLGTFRDSFDYMLNNRIDEIYCTVSQFSLEELNELRDFTDNNLIKLKLIPDCKGISSTTMEFNSYENIPILNLRQSPLDRNYAKTGKRIFDLIASSLVIVGLLSWLIPVMYILNLLEGSKGPVLFRQLRHGQQKRSFWCYKFRSMTVNTTANTQMCTRNDLRVTKVGRFIRKTSVDELPQFFNVFMGDMSIVGPRPHMEAHTSEYQKSVNKYLVRHLAKPGITGLAQVNGYRGEILRHSDIINRTRMDIYYLEKWTPYLDLHIIFKTVFNVINGEENAY